mgnify:CR=1 FL=1
MGLTDMESEKGLLNRWEDDNVHTIQSYISKLPLLKDGANTGGTSQIITGTSGTLHGTYSYTPVSGWADVLHTLSFNANQQGTFGTLVLNGIKLNDVNLGTLGAISNFVTLYGEDLTLYDSLKFEYQVNTGTGIVGTYSIDCEISGWRFRTTD